MIDLTDCPVINAELKARKHETRQARRLSNTDFVAKLMNFAPTGALSQLFVLQALEVYSRMVIEAGPGAMETAWLSGGAWVETAVYIKSELEARG